MGDTATAARPVALTRRFPWAATSIAVLAGALIWLVASYDRPDDVLADLGSRIRCPVCQGVPIADSPAPMARDMMEILRQSLDAGATRQEAIENVLGAYPGSLMLDPGLSSATIALWLVPFVAVVAGIGLAQTVRRGRSGAEEQLERADLQLRLEQVRADLNGLAVQEAGGEIEPEAARHLRHSYEAERSEAEAALAVTPARSEPLPRSPRRIAWGAALLAGALVTVVAVAGAFIVDRPDTTSGVAGLAGDAGDYSNETLAAVIAANLDHPQIDGMRLALAERYFEAGDFPAAFPYYLDVASSDLASDAQAATALTRLGWMTFAGNGEAETALELLAQARRLAPADPFPHYLEGMVEWCGLADFEAAAAAFSAVLASPELEESIRGQIESELAAVEAGTACQE